MKLRNLVPMLNVSNIERSLAFYKSVCGFEIVSPANTVSEWRWATIQSGNTELMLAETESGPALERNPDPHAQVNWPAIFYFYPQDVQALYQHVVDSGHQPTVLQVTHYGMKEFSIQDPDGHMLSFGQDADKAGD